MKLFNLLSGRRIPNAVFALLVLIVIAGCAEEPPQEVPTATRTPLPTLALKPVESDPTPTLSNDAPTRPLPTPHITRSDGDEGQAVTIEATATLSGPTATPSATPPIGERLAIGDRSLAIGNNELAAEQFQRGTAPGTGPWR